MDQTIPFSTNYFYLTTVLLFTLYNWLEWRNSIFFFPRNTNNLRIMINIIFTNALTLLSKWWQTFLKTSKIIFKKELWSIGILNTNLLHALQIHKLRGTFPKWRNCWVFTHINVIKIILNCWLNQNNHKYSITSSSYIVIYLVSIAMALHFLHSMWVMFYLILY